MSKSELTQETIKASLRQLGLQRGDVAFVLSDLRTPGAVTGSRNRDEFCAAYYEALCEVVGEDGTIVVPTYTTQVSRYDVPFEWEKTPAVTGILAEYIRTRPGGLRSLHPLHSVTAVGAKKDFICGESGTSNYSWDSPFHRMHLAGTKLVSIGLPCGFALAIGHYIEAMFGLPYVYNKLLKWSPIINGVPDPRPFFASVRHLNLRVNYEFTRWAEIMADKEWLLGKPLGRHYMFMTEFNRAFEVAAEQVRNDPYFLLREPPNFVPGELPFDGSTSGRDGHTLKDHSQDDSKDSGNWVGFYLGQKPSIVRPGLDDEIVSRFLKRRQ